MIHVGIIRLSDPWESSICILSSMSSQTKQH